MECTRRSGVKELELERVVELDMIMVGAEKSVHALLYIINGQYTCIR